eukprot:SAG25_NODE_385_length_8737_cov_82.994675_10_plen_47_part_00
MDRRIEREKRRAAEETEAQGRQNEEARVVAERKRERRQLQRQVSIW